MPMTIDDLWTELEFGLDHRGDSGAGVIITGSKLEQFAALKNKFLAILRDKIRTDSKIFSYP